jgi:pimeloyl-ACP methyl ester carboxylesterase
VVSFPNGQPLSGAIVHYKKNNIKDTTDNQGRYSIDISATAITNAPGFINNTSNFLQMKKTKAMLYNLGGRLLAQGSYENENLFIVHYLKKLPSGTYFVQCGGTFHKVINDPGFNSSFSIPNTSPDMIRIQAKQVANTATLDSLFFTALGKTPTTVMVQQNQTQVVNVTLQGTVGTYNGYTMYDFSVAGRATKLVVPKTALPQKPWIWRARFWDHWPEVDKALLALGYHLVYLDIIEYWGAPVSVGWWNEYYDLLTKYYGFNKKCVLEGMSRGGLSIFNWAIQKPDAVQAMYADAPMVEIKIWLTYDQVKGPYGFTSEAQWKAYPGDAIDNLKPLADAKVPIFLVIGDADGFYVMAKEIQKRYLALGGTIEMVVKPGVNHVHGLPSPQPIVDFVHGYLK